MSLSIQCRLFVSSAAQKKKSHLWASFTFNIQWARALFNILSLISSALSFVSTCQLPSIANLFQVPLSDENPFLLPARTLHGRRALFIQTPETFHLFVCLTTLTLPLESITLSHTWVSLPPHFSQTHSPRSLSTTFIFSSLTDGGEEGGVSYSTAG